RSARPSWLENGRREAAARSAEFDQSASGNRSGGGGTEISSASKLGLEGLKNHGIAQPGQTSTMKVRFSVGIDLGTSNSAIAVGDIESGDTKIVEIGQIVGPNHRSELPMGPSAIY